MPRAGISGLAKPPRRYDLRRWPGFETLLDKLEVDRRRARKLRRQAMVNLRHAEALLDLADRIDPEVTSTPRTLASAVFVRRMRPPLIGGVWRQARIAQRRARRIDGYAGPATVHLIPAGWNVPRAELADWNPALKLAAVRADLYRKDKAGRGGAAQADGWLIAILHASYDRATDSYQLHLHCVAAGDMVAVVEGLRRQRKYQPARVGDGRDAARTPIVIKRRLRNLPRALSYTLQSWWNGRDTYVADDGLRKAFGGARRGMPRDAECEYLLFLDRHRIEDITLLVHLSVKGGQLHHPRKRPITRKQTVR